MFDNASVRPWLTPYETSIETMATQRRIGVIRPGCPLCREGVMQDVNGAEFLRCRVTSMYYGCFDASILVSGIREHTARVREHYLIYRERRSWIWRIDK
jgi:hypothetical protein